uniref:(northern house mosquito) hypothetical protein n=1 Tax=Culex pipiens TaxID=7175 RepID=A0A8D8H8A5_CULPI
MPSNSGKQWRDLVWSGRFVITLVALFSDFQLSLFSTTAKLDFIFKCATSRGHPLILHCCAPNPRNKSPICYRVVSRFEVGSCYTLIGNESEFVEIGFDLKRVWRQMSDFG